MTTQKLEFLEGKYMISQSEVSFLLNHDSNLSIHYLIDGEPNSINCSISQLIQCFLNNREKYLKSNLTIYFPNSNQRTS